MQEWAFLLFERLELEIEDAMAFHEHKELYFTEGIEFTLVKDLDYGFDSQY